MRVMPPSASVEKRIEGARDIDAAPAAPEIVTPLVAASFSAKVAAQGAATLDHAAHDLGRLGGRGSMVPWRWLTEMRTMRSPTPQMVQGQLVCMSPRFITEQVRPLGLVPMSVQSNELARLPGR